MIKEGALADAEAIFGMHVDYILPTGTISSRPGPVCAGGVTFEVTIDGKGGHAAFPHMSIDPIVAASFIILSLQEIISREADPLHSQVILTRVQLCITVHNIDKYPLHFYSKGVACHGKFCFGGICYYCKFVLVYVVEA